MTLNQKIKQYHEKYNGIPLDLEDRLSYMCDVLKIKPSDYMKILDMRSERLNSLYYTMIRFIIYLEPDGAKRPRYTLMKNNILSSSKVFPNIHVYSPEAAGYSSYMRRIVNENEIDNLSGLICSPCDVTFRAYFETPKYYNSKEKILAEIGLVNPVTDPDWDNIGKLYSDMYNSNVWLDDRLTVKGIVEKHYSMLPRVEVDLMYLNSMYNRYQHNTLLKSKRYIDNIDKVSEVKYYED